MCINPDDASMCDEFSNDIRNAIKKQIILSFNEKEACKIMGGVLAYWYCKMAPEWIDYENCLHFTEAALKVAYDDFRDEELE